MRMDTFSSVVTHLGNLDIDVWQRSRMGDLDRSYSTAISDDEP